MSERPAAVADSPSDKSPDSAESTRIDRQRILDVAVEVFAQSTFHGVSLDDVSTRLGVTRQALYYHFRRKHDILSAIFDELFAQLDGALDEAENVDVSDRFRSMFLAYVEVVARMPRHSSVVTREFRSLPADLDEVYRNRRRKLQARFEGAYEEGVASGALRDMPPRVAVALLLGSANWIYRWVLDSDDPGDIAAWADDLLMRGALVSGGLTHT